MAYCTSAQLIQYIDERLIADLITDNNVRPSQAAVLTDPNVALSLSTASGQINSAALTAQRYTVAQLNALTGDDQNLLTMMVAWLAFGILCNRRGRDPQVQPAYKETLELLNQLRRGDTLFNVASNVSAGTPVAMFPSAVNYQQVDTIRTATNYLFPLRRQQQVTGQ